MISTFLRWTALIAAMYILQTTIVPQISIFGIQPDLLMLALFFCAIKTEVIPTVIAGFFIGLSQDFYSPDILGQNALSKSVAGFFVGLFNEKVMRLDPFFQLLLIVLMFILHDLVFFVVQILKYGIPFQAIGMELLTATLPRALYSLFFALIPTFKELLFSLCSQTVSKQMAFGTIQNDEQQARRYNSIVLMIGVAFFIFILIARLVYIQVISANENIRLSTENAMRLRIIVPPRGRILDRKNRVIARNRPSYAVCVLPYKVRNRDEVIKLLCQITDSTGGTVFDSTELVALFKKASYRRFDATRLMEDVSMDLVSVIEEHSMELPGIIVETESRREYILGKSAFHVIGYMSEIPEKQFDTLKDMGYFYGDLIGKSGIEKKCEAIFRGVHGREYIEVNAYGKSLGPITNIPRIDPIPGNDIVLSIDGKLQVVADYAFPDTLKGAVVALNPKTGEVLTMFSSPSVDPNIFSLSSTLRSINWSEIATDADLPLNNRAIAGTYTPGSTFKLVSALTALEEGEFTGETRMPKPCTGGYRIGRRVAHCWKLSGHGRLNLIGAVQQSCNVYMYQLGLRFGDEVINKYATMMGLGDVTGIDIPGEKVGWLSGKDAYNIRFAKRGWKWTTGLVLDLAIGQTQVVTPIQLALMVGGMGNCHELYRPFVIKEERSTDGMVIKNYQPMVKSELSFRETTVKIMHKALASVVLPGGTGGRAAVPGILVGGKTGSAENPQGDQTHALFVACAPVDDPVIAIAVVVENAGHGGSVAAPIAGELLRYYFSETEEGQDVVSKTGVDAKSLARLKKSVEPIVAEVNRFFPEDEEQ